MTASTSKTVWNTIQDDLPPLKAAVENVLARQDPSPEP
jgi:uncharacterized protein with HEPN domain